MPLIWAEWEAVYFERSDWTTQISLNWFSKFRFARTGFLARKPLERGGIQNKTNQSCLSGKSDWDAGESWNRSPK